MIGISVVSYFSADHIRSMIRSVQAHSGNVDVRIAIIENHPSRRAEETLRASLTDLELALDVRIARSVENRGYADGHNQAVELLGLHPDDTLIVANPDIQIISGSLDALAKAIRSDTLYGVNEVKSDRTVTGLSRLQAATGRAVDNSDATRWTAYPDGHLVAMKKSTWHALGGLNSEYFLYCEEIDLALRARAHGIHIASTDVISVCHEGGSSTADDNGEKSLLTYRHANRSRALLYRKHHALRRYFATMVIARIAQAALHAVCGRPRIAGEIIGGLMDGMNGRPYRP